MAMAENKQTLYEILGVSPTATVDEIKAAHHARTRALVSGTTGLSREEIEFNLRLLDMALKTLSVPSSREIYDTELGARAPSRTLPVVVAGAPTRSGTYNAVAVAEALHESYQATRAGSETTRSLAIFAESAATSASVLKKIFRVLLGLFGVFIVFKISAGMYLATHPPVEYPKEKARAEDMVIVQDYYQKHGVRLASRAEVEMVETEAHRQENEANRAAAEQQRAQEREERFSEAARDEGNRISSNLQAAEARARAEEERQRREEEWRKEQENRQRSGPLNDQDAAE
jgi:hypothetical protein